MSTYTYVRTIVHFTFKWASMIIVKSTFDLTYRVHECIHRSIFVELNIKVQTYYPFIHKKSKINALHQTRIQNYYFENYDTQKLRNCLYVCCTEECTAFQGKNYIHMKSYCRKQSFHNLLETKLHFLNRVLIRLQLATCPKVPLVIDRK